jgi:hypothetical protein
MRRLACSGLCALVPVLVAATTAAASWSVQPSPSEGSVDAVAATSAASAWAVGAYQHSTPVARTFIEHWNGQRWAVQPSPSVGVSANNLFSVAATAAASAWAVGSYRGLSRTLILHYR